MSFIEQPNAMNPVTDGGEVRLLSFRWVDWLARLAAGLSSLPVYANNAAAVAGGVRVGGFYRTGADPDTVCVVHE